MVSPSSNLIRCFVWWSVASEQVMELNVFTYKCRITVDTGKFRLKIRGDFCPKYQNIFSQWTVSVKIDELSRLVIFSTNYQYILT